MDHVQRCRREPLLAAILDDISEGVLVIDPDYRISLANRRVSELVGLEPERIVGQSCERVLCSGLCHSNCPVMAARRSGAPISQMLTWLEPTQGSPSPVNVSVRPLLDTEGHGLGCLMTLREIAPETMRGKEFAGIIGQSPAMRQVFERIRQLSESEATVLVMGESGTGKELVARALHTTGSRRNGAFVTVNCASLPPNVLESELFGHVRGAFTGAVRDRAGRVAGANGGTLFLDEIGDLPLELQPKLLRLLQEQKYESVGDDHTRQVDIRVIAATNVDLPAAVCEGRFREDLYYRLRVIPITLPPLRERAGDVPLLASALLQRRQRDTRRGELVFSPSAIELLSVHRWPGNVRELVNVVDYLLALAPGPVVGPADLPADIGTSGTPQPTRPGAQPTARPARYRSRPGPAEAQAIRRALEAHQWHRERTAETLGMDRVTLYRRMKRYGIRPPRTTLDTYGQER